MKYLAHHTYVWSVLVFFMVGTHIDAIYAQADDPFLDDSFISGDMQEDTMQSSEEEGSNNTEGAITDDHAPDADTSSITSLQPSSYSLITFELSETLSYRTLRDDSTLNPSNLFYVSPWYNELMMNNYIQFRNRGRYFSLHLDYNLYFYTGSTETTDITKDDFAHSLDTGLQFELIKGNVNFSFLENTLSFSAGKILRSFGSAYFINPSNPLSRETGYRFAMAKNLSIDTIGTEAAYTILQERGSGTEIGYWALEFILNIFPVAWQIAYLPSLTTGLAEFDRPDHSMVTTISVYTWDFITPSMLLYVYGDKAFTSADVSIGIGDEITLHSELGLSFENELLVVKETTPTVYGPDVSIQNYTLTQKDEGGVYPSALIGMTYTPRIESTNIATFYLELYYNGKGLWNEDWQEQLDLHKDIDDIASMTKEQERLAALSSSYRNMLNTTRYYYYPLDQRPLYIFLRISRENLFSSVWKHHLNVDSELMYSILDTSFLWNVNLELVTREIFSIGVTSGYSFGLPQGAFTELTNMYTFSIYSKIKI